MFLYNIRYWNRVHWIKLKLGYKLNYLNFKYDHFLPLNFKTHFKKASGCMVILIFTALRGLDQDQLQIEFQLTTLHIHIAFDYCNFKKQEKGKKVLELNEGERRMTRRGRYEKRKLLLVLSISLASLKNPQVKKMLLR